MYRESILGLALAATLAEMNPRLTSRQEEELWRIFDESMEASLTEAPLMSLVSVHVPPPSAVAGGGVTVVSTAPPALYVPAHAACTAAAPSAADTVNAAPREERQLAGSTATPQPAPCASSSPSPSSASAPFDDSGIAFPVYRQCDGVWTVLLKDPTVVVRDEFGKSEKMQLDYLKVCLKEISATSRAAKAKAIQVKRAKKS